MQDAYAYCERLVRENDKDRFLATLFAPAEARRHLFALYAFDSEIGSVSHRAREPMAGEIRLQWWREALTGKRGEESAANPVASAIRATIKARSLATESFETFLDAHSRVIASDVFELDADLDLYLDASDGAIVRLATEILGAKDEKLSPAISAAGRAIGLTRLLRSLPQDLTRGRMWVPLETLTRHQASPQEILTGTSAKLGEVFVGLCARAAREMETLRAQPIEKQPFAAFLPAALVPLYLAAMARAGYSGVQSSAEISQMRRQFRLWRVARSGKL